jgi:hypothetical protein
MSTQHHGHPFRFMGLVALTLLCLPFVLFLSVLTAPAIVFFAPFFALWGVERAVVEHEPRRAGQLAPRTAAAH